MDLLVVTPRSGQGVRRNTLTWKKKLYIIIKKNYLFTLKKKLRTPLTKIRNTLNQKRILGQNKNSWFPIQNNENINL